MTRVGVQVKCVVERITVRCFITRLSYCSSEGQ